MSIPNWATNGNVMTKAKIMIVGGSDGIRGLLRLALEGADFDVILPTNSMNYLDTIHQRHDAALLVGDIFRICYPIHTESSEMLEILQQEPPHGSAMLLHSNGNVRRYYVKVIRKPVPVGRLVAVLKNLFHAGGA